jgi:hypothetical protein
MFKGAYDRATDNSFDEDDITHLAVDEVRKGNFQTVPS